MEYMKSWVRIRAADQEVATTDRPVPELAAEEVLIKIQAFGVGIHDRFFIPDDADFPYVIGLEGAGVIIKTAAQIRDFQPGQKVIFSSALLSKGGCWAEYVAVPQSALILMPEHMTFTTAAAIPVSGKTALESIRALDLHAGDTLFVAGASGAIGTLVIQLAAAQGIRVMGSASAKNHAYMRSLGAKKAVDYSDSDWQSQVKRWMPDGVTAALAIQPNTAADSMVVVKDGGKVVTVSGDQLQSTRNINLLQIQHHSETQLAVVALVSDIAKGRIRIVIEQVYPFAQALDALQKVETRHACGKVVVSLIDNESLATQGVIAETATLVDNASAVTSATSQISD